MIAVGKNIKTLCGSAASSVLALALTATSVTAQAEGLYLGGGGGRTIASNVCDLDVSCTAESVDNGSTAVMAFGGYRFGKMLAVEGAYIDIGDVDISGPVQVSQSSKGITLSALAILPFWDEVEFFGRLGGYFSKNEIERTGSVSDDANGTDLLVGGGMSVNMGEVIALRMEWQRFMDVEDLDFDVLTGSLVLRF